MMIDGLAEQQRLFARLLGGAARQAEEIVNSPDQAIQIRVIADDGYSEIDRLELSPFAEDQLLAVALRLSRSSSSRELNLKALTRHFHVPASSIAIEAQRRAVWSNDNGTGLPTDLADKAVRVLERRLKAADVDTSPALADHIAIYTDLWCDPRIGAYPSARRTMLAMVDVLHARAERPCTAIRPAGPSR